MKLWLDDVRTPPKGWVWVNNIEDAKKELLKGIYDVASLDHDLGGVGETNIYCSKSLPGADGIDLVKWMCQEDVFPNKLILIHSWNEEGSLNMMSLFKTYFKISNKDVPVFLFPFSLIRLTDEQIELFNSVQKSGIAHPLTCGSGRRTDEDHLDGEGVLVATEDRWICPYCLYQQSYRKDFELKYFPDIWASRNNFPWSSKNVKD